MDCHESQIGASSTTGAERPTDCRSGLRLPVSGFYRPLTASSSRQTQSSTPLNNLGYPKPGGTGAPVGGAAGREERGRASLRVVGERAHSETETEGVPDDRILPAMCHLERADLLLASESVVGDERDRRFLENKPALDASGPGSDSLPEKFLLCPVRNSGNRSAFSPIRSGLCDECALGIDSAIRRFLTAFFALPYPAECLRRLPRLPSPLWVPDRVRVQGPS